MMLAACSPAASEDTTGSTTTTSPTTTTTAAPTTSTTIPTTTTTLAATTTTNPPTTTTAPTTTTTPGPTSADAIAYFLASEQLCLDFTEGGNPPPEPQRFVDPEFLGRIPTSKFLIRDGTGTELVVDFEYSPAVIYLAEGPEAVLPFDLSFGCPHDLYLGTMDH